MQRVSISLMLLWLSGCGGAPHGEQATTAASFDTGCPSMKVIEQLDNQRFKFEGCGKTAVYECQNIHRTSMYRSPDDPAFVINVAYAADTIQSHCRPGLAAEDGAVGSPPAATQPQAAPPGAAGAGVPNSATAQVKAVMDKVVATARTSCPSGEGNDGLIDLLITVEPNGRARKVEIVAATASETTSKCVAGITRMATFPSSGKAEPATIAYPVIMGDPSKVPDLLKSEVDSVMDEVTATASASCPGGEDNEGTVVMSITMDSTGRVQRVEISDTSSSETTSKCVAGITQMAKFPPLRWSPSLTIDYAVTIEAEDAAPKAAPAAAPAPKAPAKKR